MTHMRCQIRSSRGFTTLEAIVSLGLFALSAAGVCQTLITVVHANTLARQLTAATNLARDKVEQLRHNDYVTLATGADTTLAEDGLASANAPYQRSWTVAAGPAANTKEVTVTVTWSDRTGPHNVNLTTIVAQ